MKIASLETRIVRMPADEPLADGPQEKGATRPIVTLRMRTADGIEGIGVAFFGGALTATLRSAIDQLGALTVGEDPMQIERIIAKLRAAAGSAGPSGIFTLACAAIDIALWDIRGKALGLPVSKLVGGYRDRAPTYASGALMRHFPLEHVAKAGPKLVARGYRQMKMQLALPGDTNPTKEVERARVIRESIGPDIDLMCDINQRWDVRQAISIGKRVEQYNLFWLEDVTTRDDYQGIARVADALDTPVAGGEYIYGIAPFRQMLEARSVDIVMIDVLRAGGITHWLKIAGMAEAFNLPVVSHLVPEVHVHLIPAIPNGLTIEYMPWTLGLYRELPKMEAGELVVPDKPGLGIEFDQAVLDKYGV